MNKPADQTAARPSTIELVQQTLHKRYAAERRFRFYGIASIIVAMSFLFLLLLSIISKGLPAFTKTYLQLDIQFAEDILEISSSSDSDALAMANYDGVIKQALRKQFPSVTGRRDKRALYALVSTGAVYQLAALLQQRPDWLNTTQTLWLYADDDVNAYYKGYIDRTLPQSERRLNDQQLTWLDYLEANGAVQQRFNWTFFQAGDSREPELAGIRGALMGSLLTLFVTLLLSFPIGVAAAVYLEEFAPKNTWTDWIEININNLAAVPSIVFGLLGLSIFISAFGLPRSIPLVGGLVLSLMTLPTIIIASRAALKAVPPSIREAALGLGASRMQMVLHHVLPLAMPGMLTGTIIGMAQALGETAPLLMIGMVAFIVDVPGGIGDPATVLPVQIFLWSDSPERGFTELTAATIMVLLVFLALMNLSAVLLRKKFERRW